MNQSTNITPMNLNRVIRECNDIFVDNVEPTNIFGYIIGAEGQGADLTGGPIYLSV
jgi:hypothetical protein